MQYLLGDKGQVHYSCPEFLGFAITENSLLECTNFIFGQGMGRWVPMMS